jgi:hypothetical protein
MIDQLTIDQQTIDQPPQFVKQFFRQTTAARITGISQVILGLFDLT